MRVFAQSPLALRFVGLPVSPGIEAYVRERAPAR
jgi:hypothetical protein